jgi:glycosyltransferase involved in cell wall biosynthesis
MKTLEPAAAGANLQPAGPKKGGFTPMTAMTQPGYSAPAGGTLGPEGPSAGAASAPQRSLTLATSRLQGKRAAMVVFSHYPGDPRPRRAADALMKEGMSVDMICLAEDDAPRREVVDGLHVYRLPVTRRRLGKLVYAYQYSAFILMSALMVARLHFSRRYDLVYVHNMPDVLVLSGIVPKLLGSKVILDLHDPMPELMTTIFNLDEGSLSVRIIKELEKWSIGFADQAITVNIACKRIFSARSCPPEKVGVVMNAPDGSIFPLREPRLNTVSSAQPNKKPFVMMYHGSLVERNGVDLAIDGLEKVRKVLPNAELRICGPETPFLNKVMEVVREKGLQDAVQYRGKKTLEQLVPEIEACDVGVIPNQRNKFTQINTPTRIFEYLALGKPVIAPRTAGIQDYFEDDALVYFDPGNADDLAEKMNYVCANPVQAFETAKRGQQIYLTHTWRREKQTLVDLVGGVFQGEPAR